MSRTPSSASVGVQVAAGTTSNIYTLLLIISAVAVIGTAIYLSLVLDARYGYSFPFGQAYDAAKAKPQKALDRIQKDDREVVQDTLTKFSLDTGLSLGGAPGAGAAPPAAP